MNCPTCGKDNPEDARFCAVCGAILISGETYVGTELPMVGFGEAVSRGFRKYFTFSGRATRAEFWWWGLFIVLPQIVLAVVATLEEESRIAERGAVFQIALPIAGI
mgnify:CR=1 FL=1